MPVPKRPTIGPIRSWQFPLPEQFTLANGMEVRLYQLPGRQLISANLVLDLPLNAEPEGISGLATMAVRVADEGTFNHPGVSFAEALEDLGAEYGGNADESSTVLGIVAPATRLESALLLFAELVMQPEIAGDDVARHLALRHAELEQAKMQSPALASRAFRELVFSPDSRAFQPVAGDESSLERITPENLRHFHQLNWVPSHATLVLAGELPSGIRSWVETAFNGWTGEKQTVYLPAEPSTDSPRILLYDRPGAVQTDLRIGSFSVDRKHPDWAALQVAGTAIGGSFGSRLNARLREDLGYTYGAGAHFTPRQVHGVFSISTSVRTEVTIPAISEILQLLDIQDRPITTQERTDAINYLVGVAPVQYDTAIPIARQASAIASTKMPVTWVNDLHRLISEVTPEQATAAFQARVKASEQFIALSGDAAVLENQLATLGLPYTVLDPRTA